MLCGGRLWVAERSGSNTRKNGQGHWLLVRFDSRLVFICTNRVSLPDLDRPCLLQRQHPFPL